MIHDYCNNRVPGEMVLLSILSILSDSRTQLRVATGRKLDAGTIAPNKSAWQTSGPEPVQSRGESQVVPHSGFRIDPLHQSKVS